MSFNYTNTLEVLYGIPKNKIIYIHGDASRSDDLILGHRLESWYPEWDIKSPETDIRLLEASDIMDRHFDLTQKRIEDIIIKHRAFFETSCNYDEIYVLGLSYNDTDILYLQKIAKNNPKAKWYFNWYSKVDYGQIGSYASRLSISNYTRINIDKE